jgi:hypothetical protein
VAGSNTRRYTPPTWPGTAQSIVTDEADWSAIQTRQGDDLIFDMRIPLSKLGAVVPKNGPIVMGFDVVRYSPETWSFWARTMNYQSIFTGDFGCLLLR